MALYLIVRHRRNPQQHWRNVWPDDVNDERLKSIETTLKIGEFCRKEKDANHRVYIHRCGYRNLGFRPMICCSVCIAEVTPADNPKRVKILFREQKPLKNTPIKKPKQHENYYFESPP